MVRNKHQEDPNPGSDPGSSPGSDLGSDPGFILSLSRNNTHLPIIQARNQEWRAEKNHIFPQLKNRFSLSENHEVASHELEIRCYLERSDSILEQMVQFTFLSKIHATCSLFHQFKGKIGVI